VAESQ